MNINLINGFFPLRGSLGKFENVDTREILYFMWIEKLFCCKILNRDLVNVLEDLTVANGIYENKSFLRKKCNKIYCSFTLKVWYFMKIQINSNLKFSFLCFLGFFDLNFFDVNFRNPPLPPPYMEGIFPTFCDLKKYMWFQKENENYFYKLQKLF